MACPFNLALMVVKVSPKYQVVIPEPVRRQLGLKAGSKVDVIAKGKVAYIVPIQSITELKRALRGTLEGRKLRDEADRPL